MLEEGRGGFFGAINALLREKEPHIVRPPYAGEEENFNTCHTCAGMCVSVCEEKIIVRDDFGTPRLEFKTSGCSDCHQCLDVCTPGVLNDPSRFIQSSAKINMQMCLSHHNTVCFACKEPCMDDAIVFKGMFNPIVLKENCTGCGYCIGVCPSGAIEMVSLEYKKG